GGFAPPDPSVVVAGDEPRMKAHAARHAPRASRHERRRAQTKGPRALDPPSPIREGSELSSATDTAPPAPAPESPARDALIPTARGAFGGLLFLLTVLEHLEYAARAETLEEVSAAAVVRQMLAIVLERLDAPPDDPAWAFTAEEQSLTGLARPWLTA